MGKTKKWIGAVALAALAAGCGGRTAEHTRTASTLVISWPAELGKPERPLAEFDHARHGQALAAEGCTACHVRSEKSGKVWPTLKEKVDCSAKDACTDGWHEFCAGCHLKRAAEKKPAGPTDCGECHRRLPPGAPPRAKMAFDYSLHQRHIEAVQGFAGAGHRGCAACHHAEKPGRETACFDCHRPKSVGQGLSWSQAAHVDCLDCHLKRVGERQPSGPVNCQGCHGSRAPSPSMTSSMARLTVGQAERLFVKNAGTSMRLVPFDHRRHEPAADFCTGCHHQALRSCTSCHDLQGKKSESGGVSLAQAHHQTDSRLACVGCHRAETGRKECAGCHRQLSAEMSAGGCAVCHRGPLPSPDDGAMIGCIGCDFSIVKLPLPEDRDIPVELTLESGGRQFRPTAFPHRQIVKHLWRGIEVSPRAELAQAFHREGVFCAGCHHHQPAGNRPTACGSCHGAKAEPLADRPALREAYHRQCLGCHQAMDLGQGCADCHQPEPGKEVQP